MNDPETVLHYLDVLLKESNFTKAARELYISRPYLTQTLKRIEKKLGVQILNRNIPFSLTEAGTKYYKYLEKSVSRKNKLEQDLLKYSHPDREIIKITVLESLGTFLLPTLLPSFLKENSNISIQIIECSPRRSENLLLSEEVDCYLGQTPKSLSKGILPYLNGSETYYVVIPQSSPYFTPGKFILPQDSLSLKELLKEPLILSTGGSAIRHQVNGLLQKYKITPNIILESKSVLTATGLSINGLGITISSASILKRYNQVPINLLPLESNLISINYFLAVKANRKLTPGLKKLISHFNKLNLNEDIK